MQLSVKGKQIDVGDALRQHVAESVDAIVGKYFGRAIEAHAVFSRDAHLICCDISVHIGRDILIQGQSAANEAYAAFDSAADRIAKRIRRYKRRLRDHHNRDRAAHEERLSARTYVLAPVEEDEEQANADGAADRPMVVAELATEIPMLTVSEAVMRMDLADLPAFMFRNSAHGRLNVVYRRNDGHIGWVDPAIDAADEARGKA